MSELDETVEREVHATCCLWNAFCTHEENSSRRTGDNTSLERLEKCGLGYVITKH
jgi:hypothetical protein